MGTPTNNERGLPATPLVDSKESKGTSTRGINRGAIQRRLLNVPEFPSLKTYLFFTPDPVMAEVFVEEKIRSSNSEAEFISSVCIWLVNNSAKYDRYKKKVRLKDNKLEIYAERSPFDPYVEGIQALANQLSNDWNTEKSILGKYLSMRNTLETYADSNYLGISRIAENIKYSIQNASDGNHREAYRHLYYVLEDISGFLDPELKVPKLGVPKNRNIQTTKHLHPTYIPDGTVSPKKSLRSAKSLPRNAMVKRFYERIGDVLSKDPGTIYELEQLEKTLKRHNGSVLKHRAAVGELVIINKLAKSNLVKEIKLLKAKNKKGFRTADLEVTFKNGRIVNIEVTTLTGTTMIKDEISERLSHPKKLPPETDSKVRHEAMIKNGVNLTWSEIEYSMIENAVKQKIKKGQISENGVIAVFVPRIKINLTKNTMDKINSWLIGNKKLKNADNINEVWIVHELEDYGRFIERVDYKSGDLGIAVRVGD